MPDIGWSELAVIAILALVIIGPKDLPRVMRTMGKWMQKARSISREFQSSIDEVIREADLEDARKTIESARNLGAENALDQMIDPTGGMKEEMRDIEDSARQAASGKDSAAGNKTGATEEKAPTVKPAGEAPPAEEPPKATIITHPVQKAPPHSVVPPADPHAQTAGTQAGEEPAPAQDSSNTSNPPEKSASG